MGSIDWPFNPISLAIGAEATFVGRAIDTDKKGMTAVLRAAAEHRGSAFVEIFQNCPIFNDDAFLPVTDPSTRDDRLIRLEHGQPIRFGPGGSRGLRFSRYGSLEDIDATAADESSLLVHDAHATDPSYAFALSRLDTSDFAHSPIGILRSVERPSYDDLMNGQITTARERQGEGDLAALLAGGDTWKVS
jgi:2-oxoglutarate ferredoxin oxidoreductase subunit beta